MSGGIDLLLGGATVALLLAPGWRLARAFRLPAPALAGFLSGAVVLVTIVLGCNAAGIKLNRASLGLAWLLWSALTATLAGLRGAASSRAAPAESAESANRGDDARGAAKWAALAALPVLAVVAFRAAAHPLFGLDTGFRWGLLAELMWTQGALAFYPPTSAADFLQYVWPDGIPPLVSAQYLAAYAVAGRVAPVATAPLVLAQFVLLLVGTGALARKYFSARAAGFAVALLAVTPLSAWASTMGHETGFTALALVGLLLYLPRTAAEETPAAMLAAGVAAAVAPLAREYGWAFVVFGLALAWRRGVSPRGLALFALPAAAAAGAWYARNALLTGNPLFNHAVFGLFPTNTAHERLMALYREQYRFLPQFLQAPAVLIESWFAVFVAALAGALRFARRGAAALVVATLLVVALWFVSVPLTAAGLANSLRVLNPALALGAVLGGAAAAHWTPLRRRGVIGALALLLAADGALRALTLPNTTYRLPPARWLDADRVVEAFRDRPSYHEVAAATAGAGVLTLGPNVYLARLGVRVFPPWAPEFQFLFDPRLPPAEARRRLRQAGVRYLLVSQGATNQAYLAQCPAFASASPAELRPVYQRDGLILFEIVAGNP